MDASIKNPSFCSSCDDLVGFCENHNKFYPNNQTRVVVNETSCCEMLFHPDPIFTFMGTCYTTKVAIVETNPSVFESVNIWLQGLPVERLVSMYRFKKYLLGTSIANFYRLFYVFARLWSL